MVDWNWTHVAEKLPEFIDEKIIGESRVAESDFILVELDGAVALAKYCMVEDYARARVPRYYFISNNVNVSHKVYLWRPTIKA